MPRTQVVLTAGCLRLPSDMFRANPSRLTLSPEGPSERARYLLPWMEAGCCIPQGRARGTGGWVDTCARELGPRVLV